jgi:type 1 glutamine amidotransferase
MKRESAGTGEGKMKQFKFAFWLGCFFIVLSAVTAGHAASRIRVLLIDGESAGPYHNWQLTTPILKQELEETGLFEVTVATAPHADGDFSGFNPQFEKYQVVVSNLDSQQWPAALRDEFEKYISSGGGLVVVHAADNAFPGWVAYNQMTGIGGWRGRNETAGPYWFMRDGKVVSDPSPGPAGRHGARRPFLITSRDPEHPIMKGLPPQWMHTNDELYGMLRGPGQNMTILATAHSDPNNHGTGNDEPMLMVLKFGKGRIFHTAIGHDAVALSCVGFITTFQRGTEWAATGKVTQKVPANFPTDTIVSYRVDIAEQDPVFAKGTTVNPSAAPAQQPAK